MSSLLSILIIIITDLLFHLTNPLEITICECDSPSIIGLLDLSPPDYCTQKKKDKILEVAYEEINLVHEPLEAKGFLCKKWQRNLTVIGKWDFDCQEKTSQTPIDLTPTECRTMTEDLLCANEKMIRDQNMAYYEAAPTGKCHWLTTDQYFNYNCQIETFNVTQDCPICPIKSPYGVLQENPRDDIKGFKRGHTTLVWQKPRIPLNYECQYQITRKGKATLMDAGNPNQNHIRDNENQLEFVINAQKETICNFNNVYKVIGVPNTLIRYKIIGNLTVNNIKTNKNKRKVKVNPYHRIRILNEGTEVCLTKNNRKSIIQAAPCNRTPATYFKYQTRNIRPIVDDKQCLTRINNTTIRLEMCSHEQAPFQKWKFDIKNKIIKQKGKCLAFNKKTDNFILSTTAKETDNLSPLELVDCNVVDKSLYLNWKLLTDDIQSDESSLVEESLHHQFVQGTNIQIANTITEELKNVYCETLRIKHFHTVTLAHNSPMLAGIALGLPICRRIQADGLTLAVQQCRITRKFITAEKTKCGYEPRFENFTIGKDGYTKIPFRPCFWDHGIINLNGKSYEYINGSYEEIKPNIRMSNINMKLHFDEIVDNEILYLHNLETAFNAKAVDQINLIEQLMVTLTQEPEDGETSIVIHPSSGINLPKFTFWSKIIDIIIGIVVTLISILIIYKTIYYLIQRRKDRFLFQQTQQSPLRRSSLFSNDIPLQVFQSTPIPISPTPLNQNTQV